MKKIKREIALFCCVALAFTLAGCGSTVKLKDYKILADITPFLKQAFAGTGISMPTDELTISVSVDGVDLDESGAAIQAVNSAVKGSNIRSDGGIVGVWSGEIDVSPVIYECVQSIEGFTLANDIYDVYVPATLTLTDDGVWMLHFDKTTIESMKSEFCPEAVSAAKTYLNETATGAGKIVVNALTDDILSDVLQHVVNVVCDVLEAGGSGFYTTDGNIIHFDGDEDVCTYELNEDGTLSVTGGSGTGVIGAMAASQPTFTPSSAAGAETEETTSETPAETAESPQVG